MFTCKSLIQVKSTKLNMKMCILLFMQDIIVQYSSTTVHEHLVHHVNGLLLYM